MNFESGEEEIKKFFDSHRPKRAPESLLKNYEKEVWDKIRASEKGPQIGYGVALAVALSFAFLLTLIFIFLIRPYQEKSTLEIAAKSPAVVAPREAIPILKEKAIDKAAPIETPKQPQVSEIASVKPEPSEDRDSPLRGSDKEMQPIELALDTLAEELFILEMLGEDEELLSDLEILMSDSSPFAV